MVPSMYTFIYGHCPLINGHPVDAEDNYKNREKIRGGGDAFVPI